MIDRPPITDTELRYMLLAQRLVDDEGLLLIEARKLISRFGENYHELRRQARLLRRGGA